MLSICLHLLWESESARRPLYLRTRVSTFPKEREECQQAATLYDGVQPVPAVSPANASDPSRPLERTGSASRRSKALRISHITPETACPPASRFGAAPTQGQYIRNPPRTGTSPSRRGERYHHTHSRLHPASRAQTLIRPSGVMRVPSSAPQPAAATLHPPHPSPSTRPPSSGSRASLFVFRDSGADAPAALHTPRKPRQKFYNSVDYFIPETIPFGAVLPK